MKTKKTCKFCEHFASLCVEGREDEGVCLINAFLDDAVAVQTDDRSCVQWSEYTWIDFNTCGMCAHADFDNEHDGLIRCEKWHKWVLRSDYCSAGEKR